MTPRTNLRVAGLLTAIVLLTVGGLVGLSALWREAASARRLAERRSEDAEAAMRSATRQAADAESARRLAERRSEDAEAARRSATRQAADAESARAKAQGERDRAVRQRKRAHSHIETFLDLRRFGRTLTEHPLRDDFALKVATVNGDDGEPGRGPIAVGDFDDSQQFRLAITSQIDCYVTVLYVLPESARTSERPETCLLVYPNTWERGKRHVAGKTYLIPGERRAPLSPVVTKGEPAYLYIIASEDTYPLECQPDHWAGPFAAFSPERMRELAGYVRWGVERTRPAPGSRVAEEIVVFKARSGAKPGGPADREAPPEGRPPDPRFRARDDR